ncbi:hypothetical protein [Pseudomonas gingeri]
MLNHEGGFADLPRNVRFSRSAIIRYCTASDSDHSESKHMELSPDVTDRDTCTVQLKLSTEQLKNRGFLYELAYRLDDWTGVEIQSVQRGGHCTEASDSVDCWDWKTVGR